MTENRYHIPKEADQPVEDRIRQATKQELEKWANDSNCFDTELCAAELADRQNRSERKQGWDTVFKKEGQLLNRNPVEGQLLPERKLPWSTKGSEEHSFNPRTEVSADAKYIASRIVKHLWIIFVLLPFVAAVLLMVAGVIK
ncbi:MAG TPA: hypothetical protein VNY05_22260 [Candidatus Acidoferrales bacterium]|jgi:hypothetical protein|nr:hypothetical protein [Candidatus Acidoferrales bacterium]